MVGRSCWVTLHVLAVSTLGLCPCRDVRGPRGKKTMLRVARSILDEVAKVLPQVKCEGIPGRYEFD